MKKFNKLFNTTTTFVKTNGAWYKVSEIHETRLWIKVEGLAGSFQHGHIKKFTNNFNSFHQKSSTTLENKN